MYLIVFYSEAQVLDDSTQSIYGPTTCQFTYFENIKYNRTRYFNPDTTLSRFHIYSYVNRYGNKLQDLGNIGTSAIPVYYEQPEVIGRTSGYKSYDAYFTRATDIKLYNTRSPYTGIYSVFGGGYRFILDVSHNQNIKPNWSFGANYQKLTINKQVSATGRGDLEASSTSYNAYTSYWTKDSAYSVTAAFSRMFHLVNESGGIKNENFQGLNGYFGNNVNVNLETAESSLLRIDYLLYQQLRLTPLLELYNDFRQNIGNNYFSESGLEKEGDYYDRILINTSSTSEFGKFREISNESGLKGDLHRAHYQAYFRIRSTDFVPKYLPSERMLESYLGGELRYDNDTTYVLGISGELMQNGNHRFGATYENRLWKLSYRRIMYEPGAIHENYFGNHFEWYHDFLPVQSDKAEAYLKIKLGKIGIYPNISFSLIGNNIYYGADKMPAQANGFAQLSSPGLSFDILAGRNLHWNGEAIYTLVTGNEEAADAFRIPTFFVNSQVYYEKILFNDNLHFLAGVDAHYRTGYYAYAYNPVIQQFYLQDSFEIPSRILADVYVNLRIDNLRLFTKMTYINQPKGSGYFASPGYIGQPSVFDFGVSWMFYD